MPNNEDTPYYELPSTSRFKEESRFIGFCNLRPCIKAPGGVERFVEQEINVRGRVADHAEAPICEISGMIGTVGPAVPGLQHLRNGVYTINVEAKSKSRSNTFLCGVSAEQGDWIVKNKRPEAANIDGAVFWRPNLNGMFCLSAPFVHDVIGEPFGFYPKAPELQEKNRLETVGVYSSTLFAWTLPVCPDLPEWYSALLYSSLLEGNSCRFVNAWELREDRGGIERLSLKYHSGTAVHSNAALYFKHPTNQPPNTITLLGASQYTSPSIRWSDLVDLVANKKLSKKHVHEEVMPALHDHNDFVETGKTKHLVDLLREYGVGYYVDENAGLIAAREAIQRLADDRRNRMEIQTRLAPRPGRPVLRDGAWEMLFDDRAPLGHF